MFTLTVAKTGIDGLEGKVINNLTYNAIPSDEEWIVNMARELIKLKNGDNTMDMSSDETDDILAQFVT